MTKNREEIVTNRAAAADLQRRLLLRDRDGTLYDPAQSRSVSIAEVADDVRAHRSVRIQRRESGADCTYEVLVEILAANLPPVPAPA